MQLRTTHWANTDTPNLLQGEVSFFRKGVALHCSAEDWLTSKHSVVAVELLLIRPSLWSNAFCLAFLAMQQALFSIIQKALFTLIGLSVSRQEWEEMGRGEDIGHP